MTFDEFKKAYQPLASKWPKQFLNEGFRNAMFEEMRGFQIEWVVKLISRIIMSDNANFKIWDEIQMEKRSRGFDAVNDDNAKEFERLRKFGSDTVFKKHLEERHAETLWEAVINETKPKDHE